MVRGSREELVAELHHAKEGWQHFGKSQIADQAQSGIFQLESGASSVQAGHTTYIVTD